MKSRTSFRAFLVIPLGMVLIAISAGIADDDTMQDVVYLENGKVVRGHIVERVPSERIKFQFEDGQIRYLSYKEITYIERLMPDDTVLYSPRPYKRSPVGAFALSFLIPGAGQVYNGETVKGLVFLGVFAGGIVLSRQKADENNKGVDDIGIGLALIAWVVSFVEAPIRANEINVRNGWVAVPLTDERVYASFSTVSSEGERVPALRLSLTL
jgi:translation initiation factor IF-1